MNPGDILDGRYTIIDRLGAGGMGEVYKATHNLLGATRVIKVVHPNISSNADARERFLREARAATKIQHANVATVHDFAALPDGAHYMVWEFIDGENLAQRLRGRGTLPPRQAVRIAIQALRGLEAIHRAGIIHRDISPENLMITRDDEVKIIDLGVAKVDDTDAVSSTRTGIFVGKLRYASPEQLGFMPEGEKIDSRADIYAMAMVLVELLTGRPPYEAKSPHEYFLLHAREAIHKTVELPRELAGSEELETVLEKALARDRNQRYASAREFATALEEVERNLPDSRNVPTMATPMNGDATWRPTPPPIDTLHRTTQRTSAPTTPAEPTVRTPLPASQQPLMAVPPPAGTPQIIRKGLNPAYAVAFIAIIALLLIGAALFWPRDDAREPILRAQPRTASPVTDTRAAQVAEASLTVTSPATTTGSATSTTAPSTAPGTAEPSAKTATSGEWPVVTPTATVTQTSAPISRREPPVPRQPSRTTPRTTRNEPPPVVPRQSRDESESKTVEPEPERFESGAGQPVYIDGGGDSDVNDRMLEQLHASLRGTTRVALRAGGMQLEVARALREYYPELAFADFADVVIRFNGTNDRLGLGRKRRSAKATVSKNGRVVFRYELPEEVYRVGMTPSEAFARILADAMAP